MGWVKTADLEVEQSQHATEGCSLWTRGGLAGVEIHIEDKEIKIPSTVILDLVADEFVRRKIEKYEQMSTDEAIEEMFAISRKVTKAGESLGSISKEPEANLDFGAGAYGEEYDPDETGDY